ncbi:MAG: FAD:protein FMN transferase [Bacteroidales bacterium]|nr:FAD:protein FMN transferase [Bacteroidales bacterium]
MHYLQKIVTPQNMLFYAWFSAMHTRIDILISTINTDEDHYSIVQRVEAEIKRVEAFANRFDEKSELARLNQMAFAKEFNTSPELFQIISECIEYKEVTLGLFDITLNHKNSYKSSMNNLFLDYEKQSIRFFTPDIKLDLSGFIKGHVLRAVKQILTSEGILNAVINMGNSSILSLGNHPQGNGWKITRCEEPLKEACVLQEQCLTTSGNNKQTRWPIRNPLTGEIVRPCRPVSVLTNDPGLGEVLSTALYVANKTEKEQILSKTQGTLLNF